MGFVWPALINPGLLSVGIRSYLSQFASKFPLSKWKPNKNPSLVADNKVFAFPLSVSGERVQPAGQRSPASKLPFSISIVIT